MITWKRLTASVLLACGLATFSSFIPTSAQGQTPAADKNAEILKKMLERRKEKEKARAEAAKAEAEKAEAEKAKAEAARSSAKVAPKVAPAETKPANPMNVQAVSKMIDAEINKQLAAAKLAPSSRSSDAEFIRRATLDITGVIPNGERVEAFLNSSETDKRAKLVDELLANSKYGERLSDIWANLMIPTDSANRFTSKGPLTKWMSENFNANKPWDRMAHDLVTAAGDQEKNGAVTYYMVNQGVDKMTDSIGKLFLGVQIQCAQCHNHPFTHWKQTEYWGLAQFFYQVNVVVAKNGKQADMITPGVSETTRPNRKTPLPEAAKKVAAKFLGGDEPKLTSGQPYRPILADWICTAENPFFNKAMVNRVWAQYFGRGLVNPIDDLSDENKPSHPELLIGLAKEFSRGGFDLKDLVRAICATEAYQRTSQPTPENKLDSVLYSHMPIKVLTPEQLYDSLAKALGGSLDNGRAGGRVQGAFKGATNSSRDRFVAFFMGSEDPIATDYEAGIPQALRLMNNPRLANGTTIVSEIVQSKAKPAEAIERLYLATLARRPNDAEVKRLSDYIANANATDAKVPYSDIFWALLNSSEFALNH